MQQKIVISFKKLLKKAGFKTNAVQRVWYVGEDYSHGIAFENKEVHLEITLDNEESS